MKYRDTIYICRNIPYAYVTELFNIKRLPKNKKNCHKYQDGRCLCDSHPCKVIEYRRTDKPDRIIDGKPYWNIGGFRGK